MAIVASTRTITLNSSRENALAEFNELRLEGNSVQTEVVVDRGRASGQALHDGIDINLVQESRDGTLGNEGGQAEFGKVPLLLSLDGKSVSTDQVIGTQIEGIHGIEASLASRAGKALVANSSRTRVDKSDGTRAQGLNRFLDN